MKEKEIGRGTVSKGQGSAIGSWVELPDQPCPRLQSVNPFLMCDSVFSSPKHTDCTPNVYFSGLVWVGAGEWCVLSFGVLLRTTTFPSAFVSVHVVCGIVSLKRIDRA